VTGKRHPGSDEGIRGGVPKTAPGPGTPDPEGARLAWQPCNPIPRKRDVGQGLCAPSFRMVCPFQARHSLYRQVGGKL